MFFRIFQNFVLDFFFWFDHSFHFILVHRIYYVNLNWPVIGIARNVPCASCIVVHVEHYLLFFLPPIAIACTEPLCRQSKSHGIEGIELILFLPQKKTFAQHWQKENIFFFHSFFFRVLVICNQKENFIVSNAHNKHAAYKPTATWLFSFHSFRNLSARWLNERCTE